MEKEGYWVKFLLNEKLFNEENRILELPPTVDLIRMKSFTLQRKIPEFHHLSDFFK
jgi:hypothetical protein